MKKLLLFFFLSLTACSQNESDYTHYTHERILVKICTDGTRIWQWQNKLYVKGGRYPDDEVASLEVCK